VYWRIRLLTFYGAAWSEGNAEHILKIMPMGPGALLVKK